MSLPAAIALAALAGFSAHGATRYVESELERVAVVEDERFGGCIALMGVALTDAGLDCPDNWVSFDCASTTHDAGRAYRALAAAIAQGKLVGVQVTDEEKVDGFCRGNRMIVQDSAFEDSDSDADGVPDLDDDFPLDFFETRDRDGDGIGDFADRDDDNDGVPDIRDAFPNDPTESRDSDGDGVGDRADPDDDNDGVADVTDPFPLGNVSFSLTQGSDHPRGMTRDDERLYLLDARDARIYAYSLNGIRQPKADFDLEPDPREPLSIAYAAGHIYVLYERAAAVQAYRTSGEREPRLEFDLDRGHRWPAAIDHHDGVFRVLQWEGSDRQVYAYTLGGDREPALDFVPDSELGMANAFLRWRDVLFMLSGHSGRAYAHGARGERLPVQDFDIAHGYPTAGVYASGRHHIAYLNRGNQILTFAQAGHRTPQYDFDPSPGTNDSPGGLAYHDGRFYVGDWHESKVFVYSTTGARLPSHDFAIEDGVGWMENAHGTLFVGAKPGLLAAYNVNGVRARDRDIRTGSIGTSGIAYGLGRLYVGDFRSGNVRAFTLAGDRLPEFDFSGAAGTDGPRGLTFGLGRFYMGDWDREAELFAYGPAGQRAPSLDIELGTPFRGREGRSGPSGISFGERAVYVVEPRSDRVIAYPLRR